LTEAFAVDMVNEAAEWSMLYAKEIPETRHRRPLLISSFAIGDPRGAGSRCDHAARRTACPSGAFERPAA
jgi:hypothetical protein